MLSVQLGNGARAVGFCCLSIGDGATTRGSFQVEVRSTLSLPTDCTVEMLDGLISQLNDLSLTYQAMEDQGHAPEGFGVRSGSAIKIAVDFLARHRGKLVTAALTANAEEKGKEEAPAMTVVPQ